MNFGPQPDGSTRSLRIRSKFESRKDNLKRKLSEDKSEKSMEDAVGSISICTDSEKSYKSCKSTTSIESDSGEELHETNKDLFTGNIFSKQCELLIVFFAAIGASFKVPTEETLNAACEEVKRVIIKNTIDPLKTNANLMNIPLDHEWSKAISKTLQRIAAKGKQLEDERMDARKQRKSTFPRRIQTSIYNYLFRVIRVCGRVSVLASDDYRNPVIFAIEKEDLKRETWIDTFICESEVTGADYVKIKFMNNKNNIEKFAPGLFTKLKTRNIGARGFKREYENYDTRQHVCEFATIEEIDDYVIFELRKVVRIPLMDRTN